MARKSEKVGRGPCPMCGDRVTFHRTAGGMLNYECEADDCGHSSYAHKGSARERQWIASIQGASAAPAATPAADPARAHAPAQAAASKPSLLIG